MGLKIHQLPAAIANQIAAGEVIERPASVVKELLENSFDAGADVITVEISYGGLNQIKISDNGRGIEAEDLPLAIAAHATSKIKVLNDLYAIDTMGFRGEALASIASIAKVTISSKPSNQEHAMMLQSKRDAYSVLPCARNEGTTIDVVDLFFNAPVRKRFLKSEQLEFQAIETVFKRFALSAPHISLTLRHNNKPILFLPAATNDQAKITRMTKIFGTAFTKDSILMDVESGGMRLYGWVSGPSIQRSQNDRQWIYINQRMVKDKLINHALKQSYEGLLHPGRFPACLLYFTINTGEVDVNVHPTKHEVRFAQPRLIHDFFTSQLKAALVSYERAPESKDNEFTRSSINASITHISETNTAGVLTNRCDTYERPHYYQVNRPSISGVDAQWVILNTQFVLSIIEEKPYIVDVRALYKNWLKEQLSQFQLPLASRPLLIPVSYTLELPLSMQHQLRENIKQLGFELEFKDQYTVMICSIPISIPYLDLSLFFKILNDEKNIHLEGLLALICDAQIFDPRLLDNDLRKELNEYILNLTSKPNLFCKMLLEEDLRKLMHA